MSEEHVYKILTINQRFVPDGLIDVPTKVFPLRINRQDLIINKR